MAIRDDINVNWDVSPRIVTVEAPSTELDMQDLYDTLRDREIGQMDEDFIVAGSGLEELGGGVVVGLTILLNNALLAFEARGGPSFAQCFIRGGNLVAVDDVGATYASPIYPTAYTQVVLANSSSATLRTIISGSGLTQDQSDKLDEIFDVTGTKLLTKGLYLGTK